MLSEHENVSVTEGLKMLEPHAAPLHEIDVDGGVLSDIIDVESTLDAKAGALLSSI